MTTSSCNPCCSASSAFHLIHDAFSTILYPPTFLFRPSQWHVCFVIMLFLLVIFFLIRHAASTDVETITWFSAPNFRGTWDLIVSCVLTLTICVWSALHLNVPTEGSTLKQRNLRRTRWILLGIFAPELVVSTAFAQFLTAKWLSTSYV